MPTRPVASSNETMVMSDEGRLRWLSSIGWTVVLLLAVAVFPHASAQVFTPRGENVAVAYEGWEQNPDGSYNLVFGYMNRNWEEQIDVPVGPDNTIEPGGPDLGQPTHFLPRRNRFVFRVHVPAEFGENDEVVWTLKTKGTTERAYATLKVDYFIDDIIIMNNNGAGGPAGGAYGIDENVSPELSVAGEKTRRVKVDQPVTLTAQASDDGVPKLRAMRAPRRGRGVVGGTPNSASGLRFAWFVYRGAGPVTFDPPQFKVWEDPRPGGDSPWSASWEPPPLPEDGVWETRATFGEPGTYVLRGLAHDGGLGVHQDVTVVVEP